MLLKLKLATTICKSYSWIEENVSFKELVLWSAYWSWEHKKKDGIPTTPKTLEEQEQALKLVGKQLGVKIKKRPKGT